MLTSSPTEQRRQLDEAPGRIVALVESLGRMLATKEMAGSWKLLRLASSPLRLTEHS
jgi:hypothetical protein